MKGIQVFVKGTKTDDTRPEDEEAQQTLILESEVDLRDGLRVKVTIKGSKDSVEQFKESIDARKGRMLFLQIGEDPHQPKLESFTSEEAAKT